ncbi:hypothetical protein BC831DRAFT_494215 [Entophlyctis helioformis]|nr:hypothetical protein BC831DRAFT_494215 [Entophlyctis helioformis]
MSIEAKSGARRTMLVGTARAEVARRATKMDAIMVGWLEICSEGGFVHGTTRVLELVEGEAALPFVAGDRQGMPGSTGLKGVFAVALCGVPVAVTQWHRHALEGALVRAFVVRAKHATVRVSDAAAAAVHRLPLADGLRPVAGVCTHCEFLRSVGLSP